MTIEVPPGLVPRLEAIKQRVAALDGDATSGPSFPEASGRLVEISLLQRGLESLEQQYPAQGPELAADVEPAGKLGKAAR